MSSGSGRGCILYSFVQSFSNDCLVREGLLTTVFCISSPRKDGISHSTTTRIDKSARTRIWDPFAEEGTRPCSPTACRRPHPHPHPPSPSSIPSPHRHATPKSRTGESPPHSTRLRDLSDLQAPLRWRPALPRVFASRTLVGVCLRGAGEPADGVWRVGRCGECVAG